MIFAEAADRNVKKVTKALFATVFGKLLTTITEKRLLSNVRPMPVKSDAVVLDTDI